MTDDVRVYWADMTPTEQVMAEQVARLQVRAHAAEEAVERVRDEVDGDQPIPKASDDMDNVAAYCAGYVDALRRVRRALDGGRE